VLGALEIKGSFQQAARTLGRRRVSTLVSVGARLGRYEIRSQLGTGGMGEVYLAEDTQLRRQVKILPASWRPISFAALGEKKIKPLSCWKKRLPSARRVLRYFQSILYSMIFAMIRASRI